MKVISVDLGHFTLFCHKHRGRLVISDGLSSAIYEKNGRLCPDGLYNAPYMRLRSISRLLRIVRHFEESMCLYDEENAI